MFLASSELQVLTSNPWLVDRHSNLSLRRHLASPPRMSVSSHASLLSVFVSTFPSFYKGTSHIGLEPPLMPSSERHYICKDPLSK